MHFFTWVLALWLPIALQLNFKSLETVIDWLIILTNCLNRLQNRKYTLTLDIIQDVELETNDEFYRRLNKMNQQVKETYSLNETNNQEHNNNLEQDTTNQEQNNQEQYYKEMEEMQEQVNKLSQLQETNTPKENNTLEEESTNNLDDVIQSNDSTPEEYKDIEHIVAKVNSVNNKVYIDESLE